MPKLNITKDLSVLTGKTIESIYEDHDRYINIVTNDGGIYTLYTDYDSIEIQVLQEPNSNINSISVGRGNNG